MSLLLPFEYEFFRNGFLAAVIVGALCGFIGVYVVLRRMSYIGHGLAHAIFGGAVLSYVMNVNFFVGAGLWALFAGWLIHLISHRRWVGADAAIGVVTTSSFALGVAIVSTYRSFTRNIEAALFGNILGITQKDLWIVVIISLIVSAVLNYAAPATAVRHLRSGSRFRLRCFHRQNRSDLHYPACGYGVGLDPNSRRHPGRRRHGDPSGNCPLLDQSISEAADSFSPDRNPVRRRRNVSQLLPGHIFGRYHCIDRRRCLLSSRDLVLVPPASAD